MSKKKGTKRKVPIGSGIPYIVEYTGQDIPTYEETKALCIGENRLGHVKGGAELSYTPTIHQETDDLQELEKEVVTLEEVKLKLGIMTCNGRTMQQLADRCQVEEDYERGVRTIKLGGHGNAQNKTYLLIFHQIDKQEGDLYIVIIGTNQTGFTLKYAQDANSPIEPEFSCKPQDSNGTRMTIYEEIDIVQHTDGEQSGGAGDDQSGDNQTEDDGTEPAANNDPDSQY